MLYNTFAPNFPEYIDTKYNHLTTVQLPTFAGMLKTDGPYGAVIAPGPSTGQTHIQCDNHIDPKVFLEMTEWIIENSHNIKARLFPVLLEQYKNAQSMWLEDNSERFPVIDEPEQVKTLCGLVAIYISGYNSDGEPEFGVELGCEWDEEHGAGVRFSGLKVMKSGHADVTY